MLADIIDWFKVLSHEPKKAICLAIALLLALAAGAYVSGYFSQKGQSHALPTLPDNQFKDDNPRSTRMFVTKPGGQPQLYFVGGNGGDGSALNGGDADDSFASSNLKYAVIYGAQGGGAGLGGKGGRGGHAFVGGNGVAYGGAGGRSGSNGFGGDGGDAMVGGDGAAVGGEGGDTIESNTTSRIPTPKDEGLPEEFWNYGGTNSSGLVMMAMYEPNSTNVIGTYVFTPSNFHYFHNIAFESSNELYGHAEMLSK